MDIYGSKKCDNTIWKLHLPNMKWSKYGQFYDQIFFKDLITFTFKDKLYCYDVKLSSYITEIDFVKNRIRKYELTSILNLTQLNLDSNKREITCINNQFSNHTFQYLTLKLDEFLGKPFSEKSFRFSKVNILDIMLL